MPSKPGIYIFKNSTGSILYVGKANKLKTRVRSYFQPPDRLGPKTALLVSCISSVDHIAVRSQTEALLLESRFIRKFKPPFNIASRDDKSPYYIHITVEQYPRPAINHQSHRALAGPFLSRKVPAQILKSFRHIAPYCLAPRPVKRPCLYSHLGLCSPCPGSLHTPQLVTSYRQNITRLKNLLRGHFPAVSAQLKADMRHSSHSQLYEQAAQDKKALDSLQYLLSSPIPPEHYEINPNLLADRYQEAIHTLQAALADSGLATPSLHRIEFYDNSHLTGTSPASAMTVAVDGEITPSEFRHFTIRRAKPTSDVAMMSEVLCRRLKRTDWPLPDLLVLDGGMPQLSIITWSVPTIALAKRQETIHTPRGQKIQLPRNHPGLMLLMHLRDAAHRFSRRLHHRHRAKLINNT